jgi:hypothetical protein
MSDATDLNLREQIERIDRMHEEGIKFVAEQRKLIAEAAKLERERVIAPWMASAAVIGGLLGLLTFAARLLGH